MRQFYDFAVDFLGAKTLVLHESLFLEVLPALYSISHQRIPRNHRPENDDDRRDPGISIYLYSEVQTRDDQRYPRNEITPR